MSQISIKQGESLHLMLTFTEDDDTPADISGYAITGAVRSSDDTIVAELPIVATDSVGIATVTVADTSEWPLGLLRSDLKVASAGSVWLTQTFGIRVNRAVTP